MEEWETKTLRLFLKTLIDYGLCIYLVLILAVMPFYNREGYSHIGTDKSYFFGNVIVRMGRILLPAVIVYLAILAADLKRDLWYALKEKISLTDLFAGGYGFILAISYLFSEYKESALWGSTGWYMGFYPQIALVLTYFLVSKLWRPRRWMIYMTFTSSFLVFLLGYLNRMGVDPLGMGVDNGSFISTVGNINWYCGYLVSVFFAGVAFFWQGTHLKTWGKILLASYVLMGFGSLLTQGSDSGIVTVGAVLMAMFMLSSACIERMQMFWMEIFLLGGAGLVTYMIQLLSPDAMNYKEGLGIWLVSRGFFIFVTIMSAIVMAFLHLSIKKGVYPERAFCILSKIIVTITSLLILLAVILITVNTLHPGSLGPLSEMPLLTFSLKWGSGRGATWIASLMCFAEQGFWHKLIGVGPDAMSAYLYKDGSGGLRSLVQERFGNLILTNAHNEWMTLLVDTGILGVIAFGGMMVTGIRRFLREAGHEAIVCACGFCLLAYTVNNMFSFQQVMNVTTVFAVFGMGGAFLRVKEAAPVS